MLAEHGTGRRVKRVEVTDAGVLRDVSPRRLGQSLRGRRFGEPGQHGKWLIARTDGPAVLMHFGMTGRLHWAGAGEPRHRHDRVVLAVSGGELRFRDMRKLQGIMLADKQDDIDHLLARTRWASGGQSSGTRWAAGAGRSRPR
jgi:formamidopyrimidine-DNA glycosylase